MGEWVMMVLERVWGGWGEGVEVVVGEVGK